MLYFMSSKMPPRPAKAELRQQAGRDAIARRYPNAEGARVLSWIVHPCHQARCHVAGQPVAVDEAVSIEAKSIPCYGGCAECTKTADGWNECGYDASGAAGVADAAGDVVGQRQSGDKLPAVEILALSHDQRRRHEHSRCVHAGKAGPLDIRRVAHRAIDQSSTGRRRLEITAQDGALGRAAHLLRKVAD